MKKNGMTIVFVIVCVGVLVAAYGVGVCIREIRFSRAQAKTQETAKSSPSAPSSPSQRMAQKQIPNGPEGRPALDAQESENQPPGQMIGGPDGAPGMPTREQLENMSEEERREAFAQMRQRFGGRQREGGSQLSEEDRTKMREELEALRERSEEMSEEEMAEARTKIFEKYGITPRGSGGRPGGDRGFGTGGGGRRRSRPSEQ